MFSCHLNSTLLLGSKTRGLEDVDMPGQILGLGQMAKLLDINRRIIRDVTQPFFYLWEDLKRDGNMYTIPSALTTCQRGQRRTGVWWDLIWEETREEFRVGVMKVCWRCPRSELLHWIVVRGSRRNGRRVTVDKEEEISLWPFLWMGRKEEEWIGEGMWRGQCLLQHGHGGIFSIPISR